MSYLPCDHCGDEAITSDENVYYDCEGDGACQMCGFPGQVSVDDGLDGEGVAEWVCSDDPDAHCDRDDCDDECCVEAREREEYTYRLSLAEWSE